MEWWDNLYLNEGKHGCVRHLNSVDVVVIRVCYSCEYTRVELFSMIAFTFVVQMGEKIILGMTTLISGGATR